MAGDFMTSAEATFKNGFAPHLTTDELTALLTLCETDDPRLTQGSTTTPPPLMCVQDWPCEGGCGLAAVAMFGNRVPLHETTSSPPRGIPAAAVVVTPDGRTGYRTVGDVEEFFATRCFDADQTLGEPAAGRWFLNAWDDTPRPEILALVARWCRDILATRTTVAPAN